SGIPELVHQSDSDEDDDETIEAIFIVEAPDRELYCDAGHIGAYSREFNLTQLPDKGMRFILSDTEEEVGTIFGTIESTAAWLDSDPPLRVWIQLEHSADYLKLEDAGWEEAEECRRTTSPDFER